MLCRICTNQPRHLLHLPCLQLLETLEDVVPQQKHAEQVVAEEIPALEVRLAGEREDRDAATAEAHSLDDALRASKTAHAQMTAVVAAAAQVKQQVAAVERLGREVAALRDHLSSFGSAETVEAVSDQVERLQNRIRVRRYSF